jgi:hypothetical protein
MMTVSALRMRSEFGRKGDRYTDSHPELDTEVMKPIRAMFRRAIADGSMREGLNPDVLTNLFSGLVRAALEATGKSRRGMEETAPR